MLSAYENKFVNICDLNNDELHMFYCSAVIEIIQGG
jgi:hypothetical protein